MNEQTHNLITLTPKQLFFVWLVIFAITVAFPLVFSEKTPPVPDYKPQFLSKMNFEQIQSDNEMFQLLNPTLFAMASPKGFSGKTWLKVKMPAHQFYEWQGEIFWLQPVTERFGKELANLLLPLKLESQIAVFESAPNVTPVNDDNPPMPGKSSRIKVEGEIATRPILFTPEIPPIYSNDIYPPTIVSVVVDNNGFIISSAVTGESGFLKADSLAVELAKKIRFAPVKSRNGKTNFEPQFGKIIFEWYFAKTTAHTGGNPE